MRPGLVLYSEFQPSIEETISSAQRRCGRTIGGFQSALGVRLSQARVRRIVKTAAAGVYVSDIDVRPIVKPAARIGSQVGVPDRPCASGEQHRQTNNGQSTFEVVHWSLSVTLAVFDRGEPIGQIRRGDANRPLTATGGPRDIFQQRSPELQILYEENSFAPSDQLSRVPATSS